jgi:hypothetical protein
MYKIYDREYKCHRFIGDGIEITHLYRTLVLNKLVNSDYVLDFPFGIDKTYMLVVDNSKMINGLPTIWLSSDLMGILQDVYNCGLREEIATIVENEVK